MARSADKRQSFDAWTGTSKTQAESEVCADIIRSAVGAYCSPTPSSCGVGVGSKPIYCNWLHPASPATQIIPAYAACRCVNGATCGSPSIYPNLP